MEFFGTTFWRDEAINKCCFLSTIVGKISPLKVLWEHNRWWMHTPKSYGKYIFASYRPRRRHHQISWRANWFTWRRRGSASAHENRAQSLGTFLLTGEYSCVKLFLITYNITQFSSQKVFCFPLRITLLGSL